MQNLNNDFSITKVKTLEFNISELPKEIIGDFNVNNIHLRFGVLFSYNISSNLFAVILNINFVYKIDNFEFILLKFKNIIEFRIDNLKNILIIKSESDFDFKEDCILEMLFSISFSTTRGLLISKTSDTYLSNIYLPIINPTEVIKDMKKIKNKKNIKQTSKKNNKK